MLTGPNTASASEMLINGLHPYVQVVQVGDKTYGKDMASTTLSTPEEIHGTERAWHLIPIVYKIYNKMGQGDYSNGITPSIKIDEFAFLPLTPIGDTRDPLIQEVLRTMSDKNTRAKGTVNTTEKTNILSPKYRGSTYQVIPIEVSTEDKTEK